MTSDALHNLARIRQLQEETPHPKEFAGLLESAKVRLHDVQRGQLSYASRFDLTYNAAHALALAALRWHGYRSDKRYLVFQCLPHTLGLSAAKTQVLALCHERRNLAEYEDHLETDEALFADLKQVTEELFTRVSALPPL